MSSGSSAYTFRPGGSLKFKGGDASGGKKKKKSKSSTSVNVGKKAVKEDTGYGSGSGGEASRGDSPAVGSSSGSAKTEAERRFEEMQRKRLAEKVAKEAKRSHKDRVDEFNKHLEGLSEHYDIPKVGPG